MNLENCGMKSFFFFISITLIKILSLFYFNFVCIWALKFPFVNFSIDKVPKVTSPVLVIHGTEDEVIDFSHGLAIYERCPRAVEPLWVEVSKIR